MSDSSQPTQYRAVGISLAIGSGVLIGCSFVFKKRGLLQSQAGHAAGEGVAYLKSPLWWTGMTMMICGELCNFGAYAFVEAILVTPLGALSVVICAIMSHFFLQEKLSLFGWIGCAQCILGSIIIALNGPQEQSVSTIEAFKKLFLAPWFLAYGGCCIAAALIIIFYFAPKYGKKSMLWYITVCSLIGGISVSCTQGLGACIVTTIRGENQFKNWFTYFLLAFVACTLLTEIYYLNVALALFNTAMVTPTYYVLFTFCTLVTSVILYEGLKASAEQIMTIVLGFFVICTGIFILQMSRVDPTTLKRVDRKSTLLLAAARSEIRPARQLPRPGDAEDGEVIDGLPGTEDEKEHERQIEATEDPGIDAVGGRFAGIGGTIVRARRRATMRSANGSFRSRRSAASPEGGNARRELREKAAARQLSPSAANGQNGRYTPVFSDSASVLHRGANGDEDPTMSQLLRHEDDRTQLVTSPSALGRSPSVRFADDERHQLGHAQHAPVASGAGAGGDSPIPLPPAALLAASNTSLPLRSLDSPRPDSQERSNSHTV